MPIQQSMTADVYLEKVAGKGGRWRYSWHEGRAIRHSEGRFRSQDDAIQAVKRAGFGAARVAGRTVSFDGG